MAESCAPSVASVSTCRSLVASNGLPNEEKNGSGKQQRHRHVEDSEGLPRAEKPLHACSSGQPDETARQRGKDEQQREGYRPPESISCFRSRIRTNCGG